MAIDTFGYVKALESGGIDRNQAEAHLKAMRDAVFPELVTKTNLADTERRIDGSLKDVEQRLDAKITAVDAKIDRLEERMRATMWQVSLAHMVGVLTVGGFLIRFLR